MARPRSPAGISPPSPLPPQPPRPPASAEGPPTQPGDAGSPVIPLRGVRVRNLQSLDLDLPLGRLVGITGVSGAGKASLAFDTLFAEGRRRFVETLSTSARTLLAPIERPDADVLGGLPPAVAVRQRFAEVSPRPTLASTSDLTPLFRQLFSEAATLVCPHCQREVPHASPAVVARRLSQRPNPTRVLVLFDLCPPRSLPAAGSPAQRSENSPVPSAPPGRRSRARLPAATSSSAPAEPGQSSVNPPAARSPVDRAEMDRRIALCEQAGFTRFLVEGEWKTAEELRQRVPLAEQSNPEQPLRIRVVVDRLTTQAPLPRLLESCEQACRYGQGHFQTATLEDQLPADHSPPSNPDSVAVDTERLADGTRWRFEAWTELRQCPACRATASEPEPRLFSDNHPLGACPRCRGLGQVRGGERPTSPVAAAQRSTPDSRVNSGDEPATAKHVAQKKSPSKKPQPTDPAPTETPQPRPSRRNKLEAPQVEEPTTPSATPQPASARGEEEQVWSVCPACDGGRLNAAACAWRWRELTLPEWLAKPAHALCRELRRETPANPAATVAELPTDSAELWRRIGPELLQRCDLLVELGLGHWPLATPLCELTASESQRARLAGVLATDLVHLLFVLEEPSAGLLPEQWPALIQRLRGLTQLGNSVVVIEHHPEWLAACDWVVELGPGAGADGGRVLSAQAPASVVAETGPPITSRHGAERPQPGSQLASGLTRVSGARSRPGTADSEGPRSRSGGAGATRGALQLPDLGAGSPELPLGGLTLVQGLAATAARPLWLRGLDQALAGKQVVNTRAGQPPLQWRRVGQRAPGRMRRALVGGVLGVLPEIRRLFAQTSLAQERNFAASHFGLAAGGPGSCERCGGLGVQTVDLQFLPDLESVCPECRGQRFRPPVLEIRWRGETIAGVLDLTLRDALPFFKGQGRVQRRLKGALDLGLGALRLGQACRQLATGEALRLNLAGALSELGRGNVLLVLEEPSRGLHPTDLRGLTQVFAQQLAAGHTLLVFDQHPALRQIADVRYLVQHSADSGAAAQIVIERADTPGP